MKRFLTVVATLSALLLIPIVIHAQGTEAIEIPVGPPPTLDGVISPGEWESAVQMPLGEIPLNAMAMHDGDSVYLVLEITSPSAGWESFVIEDNGDGVFYDAGDKMIDCNADGCKSCEYTAPYDFTCSEENLPGAVEGGLAEVQAPVDMIASQLVFGVIMDGAEFVSNPFDVSLAVATPTVTPTAQTNLGVFIGIGLAAAAVLAFLSWLVYVFIKWYKKWQKERESRAREAAKAAKEAGRKIMEAARKKAKEQAKKDQAAKNAADAAKKAADQISKKILDDAANAASDASRALKGQKPQHPSNKNYKKSKPTAMKNDLKNKATALYNLAQKANNAANDADKAANGASPGIAKNAQNNAKAARNSANTAMTTAKQIWKVVQQISPNETPPWGKGK